VSIKPTELRSASVRPALPPRTGGLPIVGALPAFARRPFDLLREAREQHGDIFTLDLGVTRWVILNHPRQADYMLREHSQNYRKGSGLWDTIRELMGNGLVVSEGDFWLRHRRMIQPQFHRKRLAGLADAMVAATIESLEFWETAARTGRPCDALANFAAVTICVIARALFGQGLRGVDIERVSEQMAFVMDYLIMGAVTSALPAWLPIPGARRFRYAIRELDQVVMRIITEERQALEPSNSMLGMLLHMADADTGEQMTDAQLHDEVMTFFTAGYETTSLALAWTIHFLTQYPAVMEKVRAEIDHTLGGRPPAFADLAGLNYTRMVIQESMRLCSPSWLLPRTAIADDEIDGFTIPAGTNVVALTYGIHHTWQFEAASPSPKYRLCAAQGEQSSP